MKKFICSLSFVVTSFAFLNAVEISQNKNVAEVKPVDNSERVNQAKEAIKKMTLLCNYLENRFNLLSENQLLHKISIGEREALIKEINQIFPYLDGNLQERMRKVIQKLNNLEIERGTKSIKSAIIVIASGLAAVGIVALGIWYVNKIQKERDLGRDNYNKLIEAEKTARATIVQLETAGQANRTEIDRLRNVVNLFNVERTNLENLANNHKTDSTRVALENKTLTDEVEKLKNNVIQLTTKLLKEEHLVKSLNNENNEMLKLIEKAVTNKQ